MSDRNGTPSGELLQPLNSPRQQVLLSLVEVAGQPISTTQLARLTGESLGATAHHVRAMVKDGLLEWAGERRARGALQTFYVLSVKGAAVLRLSRAHLMVQLCGYLPGSDGRPVMVNLDATAIDEVEAFLDRSRPEYLRIVMAAAERQAPAAPARG